MTICNTNTQQFDNNIDNNNNIENIKFNELINSLNLMFSILL